MMKPHGIDAGKLLPESTFPLICGDSEEIPMENRQVSTSLTFKLYNWGSAKLQQQMPCSLIISAF
jgi:hypothetical protein